MVNKPKSKDDPELSEYTLENVLGMMDLANKHYDNITKGGEIVSHVEQQCQKDIQNSFEAVDRVFLITDAKEELDDLLLETPHKQLERYVDKIVKEEKIEANRKLYKVLEKEITECKDIYIKSLERELDMIDKDIIVLARNLPTAEKAKIKPIIKTVFDQKIKPSELIKAFAIPTQYVQTIKEIFTHARRFGMDLNNFRYNAKQKISNILPCVVVLDHNDPKEQVEKERGIELAISRNKLIDDLCLYYEKEIKNIYK